MIFGSESWVLYGGYNEITKLGFSLFFSQHGSFKAWGVRPDRVHSINCPKYEEHNIV
jgi:hypothetical protein